MHKKYVLSFTAASLSFQESITIAEVYLNCKNWDETEKIIKDKNLLQSKKASRTIRIYQELSKRLQMLSGDQIDVLVYGNSDEQRQLLWLAICKRYFFIYEFAIEVIREKFLAMDYQIDNFDYESFFNKKADWHDELEEITELTKYKLRQVLFLMMKQVNILSETNEIQPIMLSDRVIEVVENDSNEFLSIYPYQNIF